jgi:hypothetical protein
MSVDLSPLSIPPSWRGSEDVPAAQPSPQTPTDDLFASGSAGVPDPAVAAEFKQDEEIEAGADMKAVMAEVEAMDHQIVHRAKECGAAVAAAADDSRVPLPGMTDYVEKCQAAIDGQDVDLRKGIGQKFTAWLKDHPEAAKQYAECKSPGKTMQQKREFRLRWAQEQVDENTITRTSKLES